MAEVKLSLVLDDSQARAQVKSFFGEFGKDAPKDPLKGLDKSFDAVAKKAKELGFQWDAATQKFKNDQGFSATLNQMKSNVKNVAQAAKESGVSFTQMANTVKNSATQYKLLNGEAAGAAGALKGTAGQVKTTGTGLQGLGQQAKASGQSLTRLGTAGQQSGNQLKGVGQVGAQGLTQLGTAAKGTTGSVTQLGAAGQSTGQQLKVFAQASSTGVARIGTDANTAAAGVNKLGQGASATGSQLKTINGNGLKDVYAKAGQAATATKAAAGSTQTLSQGLSKVATSGKPIGAVATALTNTNQAAKPASLSVGSLSQQLSQASAKAPALSAIPTAFNRVKPAADAAGQAARNAATQFKQAGDTANGFAGAITNGFKQILQGIPTGIGISLGNALLAPLKAVTEAIPAAVQAYSDLDEVLRQVLSISGSSAEQFGELAGYVREVGAATAATNVQVGEVAISLARAGFSLEQINDALFAVVQGAEATGTGYAEMADIVVSSLGQFGLAADQAGDAVDTLTVAANSSNQTVIDLGQALKYVGPVANTVGASLQDTALQISVLANAGIKASTAGTSLRTILTNIQIAAGGAGEEFTALSRGSGRLVSALQLIGAEMNDSNGELLKGKELIYALQDSIKGLSQGERAIIGKVLAGSEGLPTLNALVNASGTEIEKIAAKIDGRLGAAADAATNNLAGLSGAFKILDSNLSTFLGSLGEFLAGFITPIVKGITALLNAFNSLPGPVKNVAFALTAVAAAMGVARVAAALLKTEMIAAFGAQIIGFIKTFTGALTANTAAVSLNTLAQNAGALAGILRGALIQGLQIATKGFKMLTLAINGLTIAKARQAMADLVGNLKGLGNAFKAGFQGVKGGAVQLELFKTAALNGAGGLKILGTGATAAGTATAATGGKFAAAAAGAGQLGASALGAGKAALGAAAAAGPWAIAIAAVAGAVIAGKKQNDSYVESLKTWEGATNKLNNVIKEGGSVLEASEQSNKRFSQRLRELPGPIGVLLKLLPTLREMLGLVGDVIGWVGEQFGKLGKWLEENGKINALRDSYVELKKSLGDAAIKIAELEAEQRKLVAGSEAWRNIQADQVRIAEASVETIESRISTIDAELKALNDAGEGNSRYSKRLKEQKGELESMLKGQKARVDALRKELEAANQAAGTNTKVANSYKTLAAERAKAFTNVDLQVRQQELVLQGEVAAGLRTENEARAVNAKIAVQASDAKLAAAEEEIASAKALREEGQITEEDYVNAVEDATQSIQETLKDRVETEKALKDATIAAINERLDAYAKEQQTIAASVQAINSTLSEINGIGTQAIGAFKSLADASTQYELTGIEKVKQARLDMIDATYKDGAQKEAAKANVEMKYENEKRKILQANQDFAEQALQMQYQIKQAELELWYAQQTVANQIAQVEAEVAIAKAQAAGASQEELNGLQQVLNLTKFQGDLLGTQYSLKSQILDIEQQGAEAQLAAKARADGVATAYGNSVANVQQLGGQLKGVIGQVQGMSDKAIAFRESMGSVATGEAPAIARAVQDEINVALENIDVEKAKAALRQIGVPPETAQAMAEDIAGAIVQGSMDGSIEGKATIGNVFKSGESVVPVALIKEPLIAAFAEGAETSVAEAKQIFAKLPPTMPKEEIAKVLGDALGVGAEGGAEVLNKIELDEKTVVRLRNAAAEGIGDAGKEGAEMLKKELEASGESVGESIKKGVSGALTESAGDVERWAAEAAQSAEGAFEGIGSGITANLSKQFDTSAAYLNKALGEAVKIDTSGLQAEMEQALKNPVEAAATALERLTLPSGLQEAAVAIKQGFTDAASSGLGKEMNEVKNASNSAKSNVSRLPSALSSAASYASRFARDMERAARAAQSAARARWSGGPVTPGQTYTVNELGREMFMSSSGRVSEIKAPAFGNWSPPTSGTVIPAHLAQQVREAQDGSRAAKALAAPVGSTVTKVKVEQANQDSVGLQRALVRELQKIGDGGTGPVTNQVTIQSQRPVNDASRMLAELSRLKAHRRY